MKSIKKFLSIFPLIFGVGLSSCAGSAPAPVVLSEISLNTEAVSLSFYVDDEFSYEGLVVTASYSDGSSKAVSEYSVSSPDMSSVGEKEIEVSYSEAAITKSASYSISVSARPVVYDAAKVCEDFNANMVAAGYSSLIAELNEETGEYETFVSFGTSSDESEENLADAAYTLASFLPSYIELLYEVYGDPADEDYYDLYGDQSYYYYMQLCPESFESLVTIISYVYYGYLCAELYIADFSVEDAL